MNETALLRKEVRRARACALGAIALALVLPVMALGPASSLLRADRVEAREIDLVDASGNAVVSLRADDGGSVTIVGADGEVTIQLGAIEGENTVLRVRDRSARGWGVIDDSPAARAPSGSADKDIVTGEAPSGASLLVGDVRLRPLEWASERDRQKAYELARRGWVYVMPRPKSAAARWGNTHGSTTWFNGYWENTQTERVSSTLPVATNDYAGDGVRPDEWRRGGSPDAPTIIEWLCSRENGIEPLRN